MEKQATLWHIPISHYSEKARWALDHKAIAYRLRAPMPGLHSAVAFWLTRGRGYTFPVLELDGRTSGDSSAIIAALEGLRPDPPLYPVGAAERDRALALEDWFDEEVGPYVRLYVYHELIEDPDRFAEIGPKLAPVLGTRMGRFAQSGFRSGIGRRFGADDDVAAARALEKIGAGFDRLESELGGADYLVGDAFGVADLTAASLLYPLVLPPEAYATAPRLPDPVERLRDQLRERPGYRWVEEMFRRHRGTSSAL